MTNKFLRIPLLLILLAAMSTANAYDCEVNGIYYNLSGNEATVTFYNFRKYYGDVVIPETITYNSQEYSVTDIGRDAFANCTGLTSVTIPNSVTTIGELAFWACTGLTSVTIPNSVTSIGNSAFQGCSGLPSITIPNSVKTIGDSAFKDCSGLTSVTIPISVTAIGGHAFHGTPWYDSQQDGLIYIGNTLYSYKGAMPTNTTISIKEGTTCISSSAFQNCTGLTSVNIPNSVTYIEEAAFYGCTGLTSVNIPNSVKSIVDHTFNGCTGLTSVTIPNSVTSIGSFAFARCTGLTSVNIPNSVTYIGWSAFYGCTGLTSATIPDAVTVIGFRSFEGCNATLYVNKGTKALLALWAAGHTTPHEIGTDIELAPSTFAVEETTQTTATIKVKNRYDEFTYTCNDKVFTGDEFVCTYLRPENTETINLKVALDDVSYTTTATAQTKKISPSVKWLNKTASSMTVAGTYIKGDAEVYSSSITLNGQTFTGDTISLKSLAPNTKYDVKYTIRVITGRSGFLIYLYDYSGTATITTDAISLKPSQPKVVSEGNVVVAATTNIDAEEENVGFEWRRIDWTDDFASNTGAAYLFENTMEGYIRNLNANYLWKFRGYYMAADGSKYYGEWLGIDPTNTSWFEPTVHTYAKVNVDGNSAVINGYVQVGSDRIRVQGFKYWKLAAASTALADVNKASDRRNAPKIPTGAATIEASGRVMEADLSGLDYNSTYAFVAFATTDEGDTYYGEQQEFTTGAAPTGIEAIDNSQLTIDNAAVRECVQGRTQGVYTLQGIKVADSLPAYMAHPSYKPGIYIVNGRKVVVK